MTSFHSFLQQQKTDGFTTEDVLVAFLPLMKQVIATHESGFVAPLDGLQNLNVEGFGIWYPEASQQSQRRNIRPIKKLLNAASGGIDVTAEHHVTLDVHDGIQQDTNLQIGEVDDTIVRPVYLPGYLCWEHQLDHHDPATDVFSLGLILASLACSLDFTEPADHHRFVSNRRNLFQITPSLHPVLARSIVLMTELDRHLRPQDLPGLLITLENYRDQEVDFETDLASSQSLGGKDRPGKRQVILSKLQERLFEINRRNRLLHFRSNLQTVNLTHSSIPLSFDASNIREDQVLTWNGDFRKEIAFQKPVWLNRFLNFREAVYLPGQLDRIRAEARRDQTEYGFAQLRLIICVLRWADLKASPVERYESPLLLVPVDLNIKKGIHDRYSLTAVDETAEVNPVVRHLFKQLYDIDLPETVSLLGDGVEEFYQQLQQRIKISDESVELSRIQKPRIELIHQKAKRKLDQFRKRARLSGRGIRNFMDLDYSYDPVNYHPLGIRVFEQFIVPGTVNLKSIVSSAAPTRRYMVKDSSTEEQQDSVDVVEAQQSVYHLQNEGDENPFNWEFDLCSVTLTNLRYRRMSLVRDYTRLVSDNTENAAFESTFSILPADVVHHQEPSLPTDERFHVVSCDPTQSNAVSHARTGGSYIIQGPPGTGKSQTITNLIADYVVQGRRVLFVCEKRAAIDVVYHRLKQQGLDELCCLIHDSQSDKKQFVLDLKDTYDAFLAEASRPRDELKSKRSEVLQQLQTALGPIADFNAAMTEESVDVGGTLRSMLNRLIQLQEELNNKPSLTPRQWERVPQFADFNNNRPLLSEFATRLKYVQADGVLANHPLCLLNSEIADADRPTELVAECLVQCLGQPDSQVPASQACSSDQPAGSVAKLNAKVEALDLPSEVTSSLNQLRQAVAFAEDANFLSEGDLLALLDPDSQTSQTYAKRLKKLERCDTAIKKAQKDTVNWTNKLSSADTRTALQHAEQLESSLLRFAKPAFWKLRKVLKHAYNFSAHTVQPKWSQILKQLDTEHEKLADRYDVGNQIRDELQIHIEFDRFHSQLAEFRETAKTFPGPIQSLQAELQRADDGSARLRQLKELKSEILNLQQTLDRFVAGYDHLSLSELRTCLMNIDGALDQMPDYLHCLLSLKPLPDQLTSSIRSLPLTLAQLEAAAAERTLQDAYRSNRNMARFDHETREKQVSDVATSSQHLQLANAASVREFVRQRFNDHLQTASLPAAQLSAEQKEFKKSYDKGRRAIEHEFSKSMRFRSIRELAAAESGIVIRDLKPVWLMSPLSVSDTLPLNAENFDVVIFDEASQITLEEAIPSLFRADQAIVVGDEMQLPPTSFFANKRVDDDDELSFEEEGEVVQYDLNSSSFLNHSSRNLPTRMLGWHYRSRSESLISFSNHAFYGGRLLTVPEESRSTDQRSELVVATTEDAIENAGELLQRPVSFHFCDHGVYDKRRNKAEAEYIAELVRELLTSECGHSIGIVAFSEAQQGEIDRALRRLAEADPSFAELLEAELEREDDGQFNGLLVKNLENIQGDERDIIIMSVCYGPDTEGRIRMNFGPINLSGGEKRLNVAFSRAKHHMVLVASMKSSAITNDYNDGANCLKNYMKYADASSTGNEATVNTVLQSLSGRFESPTFVDSDVEPLVADLDKNLQAAGFAVTHNVGQSHFRCDLAVYRPGDLKYRLGILVDGDSWYQQTDLLERELMKPQLLDAFGWKVAVVLAKDWHHDKEGVLSRLIELLGD